MGKDEQLMMTIVVIMLSLIFGLIAWGLFFLVTSNELMDILATSGCILGALGVVGLVYLAVGRWWGEYDSYEDWDEEFYSGSNRHF